MTGDARGDHLLAGLESTKLCGTGDSLHVDVFKLPHHGSENNADPDLFRRIRADHYVISADGITHDHPSNATLRWLVDSRGAKEHYTVHITHENPSARATLEALRTDRVFSVAPVAPAVRIDLEDACG